MSWICPYCGYTNRNDPLNSRHKPDCGGCDERFEIPDVLLKRKAEAIEHLKKDMHSCHLYQMSIRSQIESLKTELASEQGELQNAQNDYSGMDKELTKWKNTVIYGTDCEINRAAKAALDIHQLKLPFESAGVPA